MRTASQCPRPDNDHRGEHIIERAMQGALSWVAKLWKPKGTTEPDTSTVSRFSMRLIDLVTGKAYSADELPETVQQKAYDGEPTNAVKAHLTVNPDGTNNSIDYTAVDYGAAGEEVSVRYTTPEQATLTVSVAGKAITVACGTKHRMTVAGTLSPDAAGVLVYAGFDIAHNWSSDGNLTAPVSGSWVKLILQPDGTGVLEHYADGSRDGLWISSETGEDWPDGLTYVADDAETGTPTITASAPTAAQVVTAVNASEAASALVTATANGTVTGAVAAVAAANLDGAIDGTPAKLGRLATDGTDVWQALKDDNTATQDGWVKTTNSVAYTQQTKTDEEKAAARGNIGAAGLTGDETISGEKTFSDPPRLAGVDGFLIAEGVDAGVIFRWIASAGGPDRAGFLFDFGSVYRASLGNQYLTANRDYWLPDRSGTVALLEGPQTFTGNTLMPNQTADSVASAMNRALVEQAGLFSMLTAPQTDIALFALNGGSGSGATVDGDTLSSGTTVNARPNCWRWRNFDRNPSGSGSTMLAVRPMKLSCMGTIYHPGNSNADGKARCGLGIVTGTSAPAGEAQPLADRGWGWEIFWDASTSKIRFRLFAHNGSVFVTNDGLSGRADSIDTGISPSNADAMFFVCLGLAADGTVSAWAAFGTLEQIRAVNRITPVLTLAGGPTSGTVASTGYPSWHAANHSSVAPSIGMQFRISSRSIILNP